MPVRKKTVVDLLRRKGPLKVNLSTPDAATETILDELEVSPAQLREEIQQKRAAQAVEVDDSKEPVWVLSLPARKTERTGVPTPEPVPKKRRQPKPRPAPQPRTWPVFALAAAVILTFCVIALGVLIWRNAIPAGGRVAVVFLSFLAAFAAALVAAVIVEALRGGRAHGDKSTTELTVGRGLLIKAGGPIAAFLVVFGVALFILSRLLAPVVADEPARQVEINEMINDQLTQVGADMERGLAERAPPRPDTTEKLDRITALIAELELAPAPRLRDQLDRKKRLVNYYRAASAFLRNDPRGALALIEGQEGEIALRTNVDLLRARCQFALHQWGDAIVSFNKTQAVYPKDVRVRYWIGLSQFRSRQFEAARDTFASVSSCHPVLVLGGDDRPTYAIALLGQLEAHRFSREANPREVARCENLDELVRQSTSFFAAAISDAKATREQIEIWEIAVAEVYRVAAWLAETSGQQLEYAAKAVARLRELGRTSARARGLLGLALTERGGVYRALSAKKQGSKELAQLAYNDMHDAAGILDEFERGPLPLRVDWELIAQAHLGAGEMALDLGQEYLPRSEAHLRRVVELVGREPPSDQLRVLRGRARAAHAVAAFKLGRKPDALELAKQVEAELAPLENKRRGDADLTRALEVARLLIKSVPT